MSHAAIVGSSSARSAGLPSTSHSDSGPPSLEGELSQLSIISMNNNDNSDCNVFTPGEKNPNPGGSTAIRNNLPSQDTSLAVSMSRASLSSSSSSPPIKPMPKPLKLFDSLESLQTNFTDDLQQANILQSLEDKWSALETNLASIMDHLKECSDQVSDASINCLKSLNDSVGEACDTIDDEVRALYHLMTKCEELTTMLSVVGTFQSEIKTLRKSVETLENLYKKQPRPPISSHVQEPLPQGSSQGRGNTTH